MFAHIRQSVREQPDTGYRKSLLSAFAASPDFGGGCVVGRFFTGFLVVFLEKCVLYGCKLLCVMWRAVAFVSVLFVGITLSCLVGGFMTGRFMDTKMVRIG